MTTCPNCGTTIPDDAKATEAAETPNPMLDSLNRAVGAQPIALNDDPALIARILGR